MKKRWEEKALMWQKLAHKESKDVEWFYQRHLEWLADPSISIYRKGTLDGRDIDFGDPLLQSGFSTSVRFSANFSRRARYYLLRLLGSNIEPNEKISRGPPTGER